MLWLALRIWASCIVTFLGSWAVLFEIFANAWARYCRRRDGSSCVARAIKVLANVDCALWRWLFFNILGSSLSACVDVNMAALYPSPNTGVTRSWCSSVRPWRDMISACHWWFAGLILLCYSPTLNSMQAQWSVHCLWSWKRSFIGTASCSVSFHEIASNRSRNSDPRRPHYQPQTSCFFGRLGLKSWEMDFHQESGGCWLDGNRGSKIGGSYLESTLCF